MVNSGAWSGPRSRFRQTWEKAKIRVSPAARSFFIANSGLVWRNIRRAAPAVVHRRRREGMEMRLVPGRDLKRGRVHLGEALGREPVAQARWMRFRARRSGRRSACRSALPPLSVPLIPSPL
jgi:hypothetical protein